MTLSVLMFCPQFRPIVGGAERQAEKLSKALVQKGVRVKVLTPKLVTDSPEYEEDAGVPIHRFPLFDLCRSLPGMRGLGPLNLLLIRNQVIRALSRHLDGVDLVHMHIASALTAFAMRAARRRGAPVLCKAAMAGERNDLSELAAIGLAGRALARSMVRSMDRWVATTRAVSASLETWGVSSRRIVHIPNGVELPSPDTSHRKPGLVRRFLYLGRLSSNIQRDVPALIRSFDRLADRLADVELAVVGAGDQFQETADLVAQCRAPGRIHMPGLQSPQPWLLWADCFVLPSRREGLSNALLEAMAVGLPCIANDIPPNREVLQDGAAGVLVPVGDGDRLFEELLRMATDPDHANAMGEAGLKRVQSRYGIEAVAAQYIALYLDLLGARNGTIHDPLTRD